jgi:hypothetical protein
MRGFLPLLAWLVPSRVMTIAPYIKRTNTDFSVPCNSQGKYIVIVVLPARRNHGKNQQERALSRVALDLLERQLVTKS